MKSGGESEAPKKSRLQRSRSPAGCVSAIAKNPVRGAACAAEEGAVARPARLAPGAECSVGLHTAGPRGATEDGTCLTGVKRDRAGEDSSVALRSAAALLSGGEPPLCGSASGVKPAVAERPEGACRPPKRPRVLLTDDGVRDLGVLGSDPKLEMAVCAPVLVSETGHPHDDAVERAPMGRSLCGDASKMGSEGRDGIPGKTGTTPTSDALPSAGASRLKRRRTGRVGLPVTEGRSMVGAKCGKREDVAVSSSALRTHDANVVDLPCKVDETCGRNKRTPGLAAMTCVSKVEDVARERLNCTEVPVVPLKNAAVDSDQGCLNAKDGENVVPQDPMVRLSNDLSGASRAEGFREKGLLNRSGPSALEVNGWSDDAGDEIALPGQASHVATDEGVLGVDAGLPVVSPVPTDQAGSTADCKGREAVLLDDSVNEPAVVEYIVEDPVICNQDSLSGQQLSEIDCPLPTGDCPGAEVDGRRPCLVCGELGDDEHLNACITAECPVTPPGSPPGDAADDLTVWTLETFLGSDLASYAGALRRAGIETEDDLKQIPDPADEFLRHECGISKIGPRKKISKLVHSERTNDAGGQVAPVGSANTVFARAGRLLCSGMSSAAAQGTKTWNIFSKGYRSGAAATPKKRGKPQALAERYGGKAADKGPRPSMKHPFSQRVPGTSFVLDSFRAAGSDACNVYFLSHFHSDHYQTLRKKTLPPGAVLMCSSITASLVQSILRVPSERIQVLPSNGKVVNVPDTNEPHNGVSVQCFNANHCPGAVVMLFKVWKTKRWVLHSGDCRFDPEVFARHSTLADLVSKNELDYLYLDTTYCNPRYVFPHQRDILASVLQAASRENDRTGGRCVFFFGTYSIGKEKVFMSVAEGLNLKIYADKRKTGILRQLKIPGLDGRLVDSPARARVHILPMGQLNPEGVTRHAKRAGMSRWFVGRGLGVVFRPTGWTFRGGSSDGIRRSVRAADQAVSYEVAYSEHSSFEELRAFVSWARPARVIPTVNCKSAAESEALCTALGHKNKSFRRIV